MRGLGDCSQRERQAHLRYLARTDLYFLLRYLLNRKDIERPWLFDRCKEVEAYPDGYLDLWAREHYKSTIITFAKSIQDILRSHGEDRLEERECTIGIFSHTRPNAKGFLRQIKQELEMNEVLKELFPDVLYRAPSKQSTKWSEDEGICVIRTGNPKEQTVEAWGLVDGQPTGKHFTTLVYDDIVTKESVTTPEMILKTTEALELSYNLGTDGGVRRFIGTRYHFNDSYKTILNRGTAIPRMYPATRDGTPTGDPVLLSVDRLRDKRRDMGSYTFACQMLQNPVADEAQGFKRDWINHFEASDGSQGCNLYIIVDPASEKKKTSDYTAMVVIGIGEDGNYYLFDAIRDRLNLTQRGRELMRLHRKWKPLGVGYEKYGLQSDVEYIKEVQNRENYRFHITELGGQMAKNDRIRRLLPIFEERRFYMPYSLHRTIYDGRVVDLIDEFINQELLPFPVGTHDDMIDAIARITDETLFAMKPIGAEENEKNRYDMDGGDYYSSQVSGWAS